MGRCGGIATGTPTGTVRDLGAAPRGRRVSDARRGFRRNGLIIVQWPPAPASASGESLQPETLSSSRTCIRAGFWGSMPGGMALAMRDRMTGCWQRWYPRTETNVVRTVLTDRSPEASSGRSGLPDPPTSRERQDGRVSPLVRLWRGRQGGPGSANRPRGIRGPAGARPHRARGADVGDLRVIRRRGGTGQGRARGGGRRGERARRG